MFVFFFRIENMLGLDRDEFGYREINVKLKKNKIRTTLECV